MRDFYEKERVRVERIKYWFVIGFIGGVVFGKYVGFKFYYCELLLKGNFFLKD